MKKQKLVRDKVPRTMFAKGQTPVTFVASEFGLKEFLIEKLREEVEEFIESREPEELADIFEVLNAIIESEGKTFAEIDEIRYAKRVTLGGFEAGIILEIDEESA